MRDEECDQVYRQLNSILADAHLGWVVDQVAEQVRAGKEYAEGLSEDGTQLSMPGIESGVGRRRTKSKPIGPPSMQYSARERLHILVDAVERTVIHPSEMWAAIAVTLLPSGLREVTFSRDEVGAETQTITLEGALAEPEALQDLRRLLGELRAAIEAALAEQAEVSFRDVHFRRLRVA